jgi:hypothetical protein
LFLSLTILLVSEFLRSFNSLLSDIVVSWRYFLGKKILKGFTALNVWCKGALILLLFKFNLGMGSINFWSLLNLLEALMV